MAIAIVYNWFGGNTALVRQVENSYEKRRRYCSIVTLQLPIIMGKHQRPQIFFPISIPIAPTKKILFNSISIYFARSNNVFFLLIPHRHRRHHLFGGNWYESNICIKKPLAIVDVGIGKKYQKWWWFHLDFVLDSPFLAITKAITEIQPATYVSWACSFFSNHRDHRRWCWLYTANGISIAISLF